MNCGDLFFSFLINLQSHFKKNVKVPGLSFQQIIALLIIPEDGIEMTDLSIKLGIDNSTTTRLVSGLINKNFVIKSQSKNDKRIRIVYISSKGRKIQSGLELKVEEIGKQIEELIDPKRYQEAVDMISSINWGILKSSINK